MVENPTIFENRKCYWSNIYANPLFINYHIPRPRGACRAGAVIQFRSVIFYFFCHANIH